MGSITPMPTEWDVVAPAVISPPCLDDSMPNMNLIVGGTLDPTTQARSSARIRPPLSLPSFQSLGIASARFGPVASNDAFPFGDTLSGATESGRAERPGDTTLIDTLRRGSDALLPPALDRSQPEYCRADAAADSDALSMDEITATLAEQAVGGALPPMSSMPWASGSWLRPAIVELLQNVPASNETIRVFSQALPRPAASGQAFATIVEAIHPDARSSSTEWINVLHAMAGKFSSGDVPSSPPATPGPPQGGDDYFTQKVFDTAVEVFDYQQNLGALQPMRHAVPPSSINVSIVERYIPPTNSNEFSGMFRPDGPSVLVDRLVELSPENGCLVFVYPTRRGAETFTKQVLEPVLDPLTRSMAITNNLALELSKELAHMDAVTRMPTFEQMKRSLQAMCEELSRRSSGAQKFHGGPSRYELRCAYTEKVALDGETWAKDWWTPQEKPRIREVMARYVKEAQKRSTDRYGGSQTATGLWQKLFEDVVKRSRGQEGEAEDGVEVGVFVVRRSKSETAEEGMMDDVGRDEANDGMRHAAEQQ